MWIFLVTEVMFFGGLLMAYLLYRVWYPEAWSEGSLELDIVLGGFNTVVLIGSSLTMAFGGAGRADRRAEGDRPMAAAHDGARADLSGRQVLRVHAQVGAQPHSGPQLLTSKARTPRRSRSFCRCTSR